MKVYPRTVLEDYLFTYLSIYLSISVCSISIYLSIYLNLSVPQSVQYLSIYLSIFSYLFIWKFNYHLVCSSVLRQGKNGRKFSCFALFSNNVSNFCIMKEYSRTLLEGYLSIYLSRDSIMIRFSSILSQGRKVAESIVFLSYSLFSLLLLT